MKVTVPVPAVDERAVDEQRSNGQRVAAAGVSATERTGDDSAGCTTVRDVVVPIDETPIARVKMRFFCAAAIVNVPSLTVRGTIDFDANELVAPFLRRFF